MRVVDLVDAKHHFTVAVERQIHEVKRIGGPPDVGAGAPDEQTAGISIDEAVARLADLANIQVAKSTRRLSECRCTAL